MAPKMSKMSSPGTPWAPGGYQDAIEIGPGALLEASGGETKFAGSGRGASRKVLGPFFNVLSRPRAFSDALGAPGGSFWRLIAENPRTQDFEYFPREGLDFEGSGRSFL